jgi:hypothetical protein
VVSGLVANQSPGVPDVGSTPTPSAMNKKDELIAALLAELEEQWASNHFEHCGREWPHPPDQWFCGWPKPDILKNVWITPGTNPDAPSVLRVFTDP